MNKLFFTSAGHKTRFIRTMEQLGMIDRHHLLDQSHAPLLYVLTASIGVFDRVQPYIEEGGGIQLQRFLDNEHFGSGQFVVLSWAGNLFDHTRFHCDPTSLMILDVNHYQLCLSALALRRNSISVLEVEAS